MKENAKKIVVLLLVAFVAVGSYFVAGTYAKYTSDIAGTATGTVAKWAWTINTDTFESTSDVSNGFTFDLFGTIKEADTTTAETDVASAKIAPGTGGQVAISINNRSEVNAEYSIAFTETNTSNVPIEYSLDGTNWTSTVSSLDTTSSPTAINMNTTDNTTKVYWRWVFGDPTNNTTDTALGFAANTTAPTVTLTATVTVSQVD